MKIAAVIAEFNPLHNGHKYLIDKIKSEGYAVVAVLSDNFVQRGDVSLLSKFDRAELAVKAGADLCIELPCPWSMSFAQNYAYGAISIIKSLGNVERVCFSSECGDIQKLKKAAEVCNSPLFKEKIQGEITNGVTFSKNRQSVAESLYPELSGIFEGPNNSLGIEYINAAEKLNFPVEFVTFKRIGNAHDIFADGEILSASHIRSLVLSGKFKEIKDSLPEFTYNKLFKGNCADIRRLYTCILMTVRTMPKERLANLPDISEGLENRLYSAIRISRTFEGLISEVKSKRYTMARIRRICLSAFLDIDNSFTFKNVPYLRVLSMSDIGEKIIKSRIGKTEKPLVMKAKDIECLDEFSQKTFGIVSKATDIYALAFEKPYFCGLEYTTKLIK